ncbi:MAG: hypothetical protein J5846_02395 [Desulfovibrio sp.]|nr:hypothetical protein [Desulfovibrio sp.]
MSKTDIRHYIAFSLWLTALALAFACSSWRMHDIHARFEQQLSQRVAAVAEELASLLAVPGWNLDVTVARALIFAAMRDPELYAVKIAKADSLLEAQRRGASGELEPWDGVLLERTVQTIKPITSDSGEIGTVEVYLRADNALDLVHAANVQEVVRFLLHGFLATLCYLLYRISCGELVSVSRIVSQLWQRLRRLLSGIGKMTERRFTLSQQGSVTGCAEPMLPKDNAQNLAVTRVLFVHAFAHAPEMLSRFLAEENVGALQHLIGLMEQAAPCVEGFALHQAACTARKALARDDKLFGCEVEACIVALENLLMALQSR